MESLKQQYIMGVCTSSSKPNVFSRSDVLSILSNLKTKVQIQEIAQKLKNQISLLYSCVSELTFNDKDYLFYSQQTEAIRQIRTALEDFMNSSYYQFSCSNLDISIIQISTLRAILICYLAVTDLRKKDFSLDQHVWWTEEYFYPKMKAIGTIYNIAPKQAKPGLASPILNYLYLIKKLIEQSLKSDNKSYQTTQTLRESLRQQDQLDGFYEQLKLEL